MVKVKLSDYASVLEPHELEEIKLLAKRLEGKRVKMVNSTSVGGGVAEILHRLIPLLNELGIETKWEVIKGAEDFFEVTKAFHNALQGDPVDITERMYEIYQAYNEQNAEEMNFDEDFVVIHDPQPAMLVKKRGKQSKWIWRCHIDLSHPHEGLWQFLKQYVIQYDASIFSVPQFSQDLPIPQYLVSPSIDPVSDKNKELSKEFISQTLKKYHLDPKRPILTQISRFDRFKDPIGVIEAYQQVKKRVDCQLVLAGGGATDDPEGSKVLSDVEARAKGDPDIHVLTLPPFADLEINALQRGSTLVLQKSTKEGFGLTVAEALWKGKPVIGGAVGGIPSQILHDVTGVLVHSPAGAAYQIRRILGNLTFAKELGENGKEHVRENFILTKNLRNYLLIFLSLMHPTHHIISL